MIDTPSEDLGRDSHSGPSQTEAEDLAEAAAARRFAADLNRMFREAGLQP